MSEPANDMDLLPGDPESIVQLCPLRFTLPAYSREMILHTAWGVRVGPLRYLVPRGMRTDGASIPRVLWRVLDPPFYSRLSLGAVIHDAAYKGLLAVQTEAGCPMPDLTREEADELLRELAEWNGYGPTRAALAYRGVRWFGQAAWDAGHWQYGGMDRRALDYGIPRRERTA